MLKKSIEVLSKDIFANIFFVSGLDKHSEAYRAERLAQRINRGRTMVSMLNSSKLEFLNSYRPQIAGV